MSRNSELIYCPIFVVRRHGRRYRSGAVGAADNDAGEPTSHEWGIMMNEVQRDEDRLDAWVDGPAICVIARAANGDPLDLSEDEVKAFIEKLQACIRIQRSA
jgi:hypothetical protein